MIEKGVLEYFDLDLKYWNKRSQILPIIEKKEEEWIKKNFTLNKKMKILDFACGVGRLCNLMHGKVKKIVAVDISKRSLRALQNKNYKNVKVILASDEVLNKYKRYFDIILFAQAIEFYRDSSSLIKGFYNSLSSNGKLFISTWLKERIDAKNIKGKYVIAKRPSDNKEIKVFFNPKTIKELKEELENAGFKNIRIEKLKCKLKEFPKNYIKGKEIKNLNKEIDLLIVAKAEK